MKIEIQIKVARKFWARILAEIAGAVLEARDLKEISVERRIPEGLLNQSFEILEPDPLKWEYKFSISFVPSARGQDRLFLMISGLMAIADA